MHIAGDTARTANHRAISATATPTAIFAFCAVTNPATPATPAKFIWLALGALSPVSGLEYLGEGGWSTCKWVLRSFLYIMSRSCSQLAVMHTDSIFVPYAYCTSMALTMLQRFLTILCIKK